MPIAADEREYLASVGAPDHATVVARANEFCGLLNLSATQLAELLRREYGRGARSTMLMYLRGDYTRHSGRKDTTFMDARVWEYVTRHWPKPLKKIGSCEPMLDTRGSRKIAECFEEALEGHNSLIYGPPASEKSFVLQNLVQTRRDAGKNDAIYIESTPGMSKMTALRRICREAGIFLARAWTSEHYSEALLAAFDAMPAPPALIFDEAQLVPWNTLEEIRILHNRSRRRERDGCGIIFAGSHNLLRYFMSRSAESEHMLSRFPTRVQLEGMSRQEALDIAARAWNPNGKRAKFPPEIEARILASCEVADPYATDADGRPLLKDGKPVLRTYYSPRRLLHYMRQQKKNVSSVMAKGAES